MEETDKKSSKQTFGNMDSTAGIGVEMLKRDIPPAHFIFMIRSFSLLNETGNEKHESGVFQACDKKWKLCVYPKGKKKPTDNGDGDRDGHISLYLEIVDTNNYPVGWEVHVKFSLFVYDHVQDNYLTVQDVGGKVRRFHYMKTQWGFNKLLPLSIFNDPSNGYLVDDTCAFGAEIFFISNATKRECLSMVKDPTSKTYRWRINNFASKKNQFVICSDEFTIEGSKWKLMLYPIGDRSPKGKHLSLFLELVDSNIKDHGRKLYAKYKMRICNQLNSSEHKEKQAEYYFGASAAFGGWGYSNFMSLDEVESATKGFLINNDTLVVEVEFMLLTKFSEF